MRIITTEKKLIDIRGEKRNWCREKKLNSNLNLKLELYKFDTIKLKQHKEKKTEVELKKWKAEFELAQKHVATAFGLIKLKYFFNLKC